MQWARGIRPLKRSRTGFSLRAASALAIGSLALLATGCRSTAQGEPLPIEATARPEPAQPAWIGAPLSWEKLEAIERWLVESADAHDPALEIEARLELAEGRAEFARRDLQGGAPRDAALLARMELARRGFEELTHDERASAGQRARAQTGLNALRGTVEATPTSTLPILPRSAWKAQAARTREMTAMGGRPTRITVHHSALAEDESAGSSPSQTYDVLRRIQSVHMDRSDPNHGWGDIGYHFLVDGSGRVLEGRELAWQGAHARGANNRQNIGICMLGDFSRRAPTPAAMRSLQRLLDDLRARFRIPASHVLTHKELTSTDCPGPSLSAWVERYRRTARPGS